MLNVTVTLRTVTAPVLVRLIAPPCDDPALAPLPLGVPPSPPAPLVAAFRRTRSFVMTRAPVPARWRAPPKALPPRPPSPPKLGGIALPPGPPAPPTALFC